MTEKAKILIVDDDIDFLDQISAILKARGFEVVEATSRAEAEEALLRIHPTLAILDLMMEEMDSGFVLCHTIKRLYPDLPVILLTSVTAKTGISFKTQDARSRSWIQADCMLDKPVRSEELTAAINKLLNP